MNADRDGLARIHRILVGVVILLLVNAPLYGDGTPSPLHEIAVEELPQEARATLALIKQGGSFPYKLDGKAFGNFERHLPVRAHGYYREYTVRTPGSRDRGPRRIVAGRGETGDVRTSGEYYYTDDHYRSFRRIRE